MSKGRKRPQSSRILQLDADILLVEEAPSFSHFDFGGYDRSQDYEWYQRFYEEDHLETILSWPPVTLFLQRVFEPLGFERSEIPDEVYMTSSVKCPVSNREFDEPFASCRAYLEREIADIDPEVIITAGKLATEGTAKLLGVPPKEDTKTADFQARLVGSE